MVALSCPGDASQDAVSCQVERYVMSPRGRDVPILLSVYEVVVCYETLPV